MAEKTEEVGCFPYVVGYIGALLLLIVLGWVPNVHKSVALYFSDHMVEATLTEHYCPDDHVYIYSFQLGTATYEGTYVGYLGKVEDMMEESDGCEGKLSTPVKLNVRFVKAFPKWNEPFSSTDSIWGFIFRVLLFLVIWIALGNVFAKEAFK